jgi:hypothetical protein
VGQQLRELAVVRQHQESLGVAIEAPDGEHPRLRRHQIHHRAPALRIARGRDETGGFVQQPVHERGIDDHGDTVECDLRTRGIRACAENRDLPVHDDATGGDHQLARTPGPEARAREELLQALAFVVCAVPSGRVGHYVLRLGGFARPVELDVDIDTPQSPLERFHQTGFGYEVGQ